MNVVLRGVKLSNLESDFSFEVADLNGEIVSRSENVVNNSIIDLSSLREGNDALKVVPQGKAQVFKIVKN